MAQNLKGKILLDVGCGKNVQPGYIGMDKRKLPGVDIVHDIENIPWPFEDGIVSLVLMSHIVEHIKPWLMIDVIDEAWRILEKNGLLFISTPYGGGFRYYQDPTHCCPWNEATVEYFIPGCPLYEVYEPKPWQMEKRIWVVDADLEIAMRKISNGNDKNIK